MLFSCTLPAYSYGKSSYTDIGYFIASSAPMECAFSTAGECTSTKRNRLANQNLETEVLIRATSITLYCNKTKISAFICSKLIIIISNDN